MRGKNTGNNQKFVVEKPRSSSSAKRKATKTTAGDGSKKNEAANQGPPQKKRKNGESSNSSNCDEIQIVVKELTLNDLPQKVVKKILGFLDTPTLFVFRLTNPKFHEMCSKILCSRPKAKIHCDVFGNELFVIMKPKNTKLTEFLACFKESKNCPFAHFSFDVDRPIEEKFFELNDWLSFLTQFDGSKMKSLKLLILYEGEQDNLMTLMVELRDLLCNQIKNLEEFGLNISSRDTLEFDASQIKLFSSPIQLPHLKVLHLGNSLQNYPRILKDLLSAAVNLKRIQFFSPDQGDDEMFYLTPTFYQLLQSTGIIRYLEDICISLDAEFLKVVTDAAILMDLAPPGSNFKLKKLTLIVNLDAAGAESESQILTSFISKMFSSSKNSLTRLTFKPLGRFGNLQFPTFPNLTDLYLIQLSSGDRPFQLFPCGVRSRNIFPAVEFLDLAHMGNADWCDYFPQLDSIPRLPNVKTLSLVDQNLKSNNAIVNISLMFINLKQLKISRKVREAPKINFLQVVRAIWTDLKQLEYLEIDVNVDSEENSTSDLDSCFTGFSPANCQRLHEVMSAVQTFKKWGVSVPKSELKVERDFASILEMKGGKLLERKHFFKDKLTWISEEYAFKLMPQLHVEK